LLPEDLNVDCDRQGHFIITIAKHKPYIHSKAVKEALNAIDQVRAEEA
jgi:hypothetical protein